MFQDWTWQCDGCKRFIEPYESHDMEKCYAFHGVKPYTPSPLTLGDRIFVVAIKIFLVGVLIFLVRTYSLSQNVTPQPQGLLQSHD